MFGSATPKRMPPPSQAVTKLTGLTGLTGLLALTRLTKGSILNYQPPDGCSGKFNLWFHNHWLVFS